MVTSPSVVVCDVFVIGLGLAGTSVAAAISKQSNLKVIAVDSGNLYNELGSSFGETRITRPGLEHQSYTSLSADSIAMMKEIEGRPGEIINNYPCVHIVKQGSKAHELYLKNAGAAEFTKDELTRYFGLEPQDGYVGIYEGRDRQGQEKSATLNPRALIDKLRVDITSKGNETRFNEKVVDWKYNHGSVIVTTTSNSGIKKYQANKLVIATNSWTKDVLAKGNLAPELSAHLQSRFSATRVPLFFFEWPKGLNEFIIRRPHDDGHADLYAMMEPGKDGKKYLKIGFHDGTGVFNSPDSMPKEITQEEIDHAKTYLTTYLGIKDPKFVKGFVCNYCMTKAPSKDKFPLPVIGPIPGTDDNILMLAGGCGNLAKMAVRLGDQVASMILGKTPKYDLSDFSPESHCKDMPSTNVKDPSAKTQVKERALL